MLLHERSQSVRILLLTALMAIPASAASVPGSAPPLFTVPDAPVPVISVPAHDRSVINPSRSAALGLCPPTAAQMAADRASKSGGPLFHKLTELPPGKGYMAVYRTVDGCADPMTMVEYRSGEKR
jgi:hypothetical protein